MREKIIAPEHIALIPDGNRRWSALHKFKIFAGYRMGIRRFIQFAKWSKEFGVKTVSVWALSSENLTNRTNVELNTLYTLYTRAAKSKSLINDLKANKTRLRIIGNLGVLPKKLRDALREAERQTKMYREMTINMLINYGGKEDLTYSIAQLAKDAKSGRIKEIDEEAVQRHLRSASIPDVDLIVRTSGEMRLSGLLPWQGGYSELYFAKKYWPDFEKKDLKKAIETFSKRQRRFGK